MSTSTAFLEPAKSRTGLLQLPELRTRAFWLGALRYLAACLLPSLPFILARQFTDMRVAEFNLDYAALALVSIFLGSRIAAAGFVLTYIVEALKIFDNIYYFSQQDIPYALRFAFEVKPQLLLGNALLVIVLCATCTWLWLKVLPRRNPRRLLAVLALLPSIAVFGIFLVIDTARGFNPNAAPNGHRWGTHLVGETAWRTTHEFIGWGFFYRNPPLATASAASDTLRSALPASHPNVLLIVVESMGLLKNAADYAGQTQPFANPAITARYRVDLGSVAFSGPTIPGEMRELCGISTGLQVNDDVLTHRTGCLPSRFAAAGYQTLSVHGYKARMFQRGDWYPQIGFAQSLFLEQLSRAPDMHRCDGAFPGICDADIAALLHARLLAQKPGSKPLFLYWMTLNSHLPVAEAGAPPYTCRDAISTTACAQLGYVERVLTSVAQLAADPGLPPTEILLVGDHAPPYVGGSARRLFDADHVPYIRLTPHSLDAPAGKAKD